MIKGSFLFLSTALLAVSGLAGSQEGTDFQPVEIRHVDTVPDRLQTGDEIDRLEASVKPPHRFAAHKTQWRVETRSFSFLHFNKTEQTRWTVVLDHDKIVAVIRSGDILLLALTPASAPTKLALPTERLHLDNLPGPSFPIYAFINKAVTHGSIYETSAQKGRLVERWETCGRHLAFVRRLALDEHNVEARFVFTVDPVYGYRIDGVRDVSFAKSPGKDTVKLPAGTYTPGCYPPWAKDAIYHRTVYTPSAGGFKGWANNLLTMDRCDADRARFDWRDGGFIAYLPGPGGWSPCFTRQDGAGPTRKLSVCNAHNDFHHTLYVPELAVDAQGRFPYRYVHRLMALPPEMSTQVWNKVELIQQNATGLIVKIGETEDFERQPVPLTEPARGLVWTSGEPSIVRNDAHSGVQSIKIKGTSWPNLPQVSLQPHAKYRLEGWFKIIETEPGASPRAFIKGDFYEWSPHSGPMIEKQATTAATRVGEWEHVVLDFTAPAWGPFINISFVVENGMALLDDFALRLLP
jgi:hypothetical protein